MLLSSEITAFWCDLFNVSKNCSDIECFKNNYIFLPVSFSSHSNDHIFLSQKHREDFRVKWAR